MVHLSIHIFLLFSASIDAFHFSFTNFGLKFRNTFLCMSALKESEETSFYKSLEEKLLRLDKFEEVDISDIYRYKSSQLMKSPVEFSCKAYKGNVWIRYLRIIKFIGTNYDVLNIMAVPYANSSLPILGIDTVALPGRTVVAIDLQPAQPSHLSGEFIYPNHMLSLFTKYNKYFPSIAADFPAEAKPYFSPYAILSKLDDKKQQLTTHTDSSDGDDVVATITGDNIKSRIEDAVMDYVTEYKCLIKEATKSVFGNSTVSHEQHIHQSHIKVRENAIYNYLDYRFRKDPAKNLLSVAFGSEWTEGVLPLFFPHDELTYADQIIDDYDPLKTKITLVTGSTKKRDEILDIIGTENNFYFETVDVSRQGTASLHAVTDSQMSYSLCQS